MKWEVLLSTVFYSLHNLIHCHIGELCAFVAFIINHDVILLLVVLNQRLLSS